jgi:hypothetical protein
MFWRVRGKTSQNGKKNFRPGGKNKKPDFGQNYLIFGDLFKISVILFKILPNFQIFKKIQKSPV